jgi:hypothetical protein
MDGLRLHHISRLEAMSTPAFEKVWRALPFPYCTDTVLLHDGMTSPTGVLSTSSSTPP